VSVHPFIEAEKQGGHSVKRACELLGVSRAAFYARRNATPGPRATRDAELAEQIARVHARSRGSYGAPRVHAQLRQDGQRCGRRRVARLIARARPGRPLQAPPADHHHPRLTRRRTAGFDRARLHPRPGRAR
jgi:putative transposase